MPTFHATGEDSISPRSHQKNSHKTNASRGNAARDRRQTSLCRMPALSLPWSKPCGFAIFWAAQRGQLLDVMSGTQSRRAGLTRLMADAAARRFRCVLVWKLDRFGRSLVDCLNNIQTLETCGVRFIAVTQGLDTDQRNPASRFMLQVLGAAAEFERSLIRERSLAGQMRYR